MNLGRNSGFWDDWYRYGFQNQEKDDEVKGAGNSVNYKYRMHSLYRLYGNPRLGRFFAVDPLASDYPYNSPYAFSENVVINAVELEGLEKVYIYNVWKDENGNRQRKLSHTKIDHSSKVDKRVYRYFDGQGNVKREISQTINGTQTNVAYAQDGLAIAYAGKTTTSSEGELYGHESYGTVFAIKTIGTGGEYGYYSAAEASFVKGGTKQRFGFENMNLNMEANGSVGIAELHGEFGSPKGQKEQFQGLHVDIGAKAAVVEGDIDLSSNLYGMKSNMKVGGCALCAGLTLKISAGYNTKSNTIDVNVGGELGILLGVKMDLKVSIPIE
jgi:hypothetical protein